MDMKIIDRPGYNVELTAISRKVITPEGKETSKIYRKGDPVFDEYAAEQIKRKEPHLPKNFMFDGVGLDGSSGVQIAKQIKNVYCQYYDGNADEHDIATVLSDVVDNLKRSYINMGYEPEKFMPKLLLDVYDNARFYNIHAVDDRSCRDSLTLAAKYNGSDRNSRDTIYYDAKYYYQSEEMKNTQLEIMKKIGQRHGVTDLDLPTEYPKGSLQESLNSSYNTRINESARNDTLVGNMLDESFVPPPGFKFFYKGNEPGSNIYPSSLPSPDGTADRFDGVLHVWYNDWSFVSRVPVRQDATKFPISVNMYELVSSMCDTIPEEIVPALKNFDFFTMIQSGNYKRTHPRNI